MKRVVVLSLALFAASQAHAAGSPWTAQAGVSSEYMSKGASKTDGDPQVWGRVEVAHDGFYAGTWVSNVKIPQRSDAEVQLYVGHKSKVAGYAVDLSAFYKTFPGTRAGVDDDLVEFRADVNHPIGPLQARLRTEWTPDNFGATRQALWVEGRLAWPISAADELSAAVGRRDQNGGADYVAWNLGVKHVLTPHVSADLRWFDTDSHSLGDNYHGRVVAGLTASF